MLNSRKVFLFTLLFFLTIFCIYYLLYRLGVMAVLPDNYNLLRNDADWYYKITEIGYYYQPKAIGNTAFFPFFPFFWKFTGLSSLGISVINLLLFCAALSLLNQVYKFTLFNLLFICTIPSFIFFIVPYSEALFFLFGSIYIYGLCRGSFLHQGIGLLGSGLTRSVVTIFIPAVFIVEICIFLFYTERKWGDFKDCLMKLLYQCSLCLLSIGIVAVYQYTAIGKWFYFIEIQQYWGRHFQWPTLPFTTFTPQSAMGMDTIGLSMGFTAIALFLFLINKVWYRKVDRKLNKNYDRALIFSLCYFIFISILDVFFTNDYQGHTKIWSINRHLLCTPYFFVILFGLRSSRWSGVVGQRFFMAGVTMIFLTTLFLTQISTYPIQLIYFIFFSVYLLKYIIIQGPLDGMERILHALFVSINVMFYLIYMQNYLQNGWLG
ncbi:hypothetical protein [Sphingobacterium sp. 18053]|uniref:hypothetical protein n=1 Tax=Sphingobacterium sp. 18053 TaxID=2681401 RepID=UPI00129C8A04|nr:hypothetical protein [Sphingobacterium sp. 18053]